MAYVCPYCKEEKQTDLSVEVKYCLKCKRIQGCYKIFEFLRKIGVQEEVINEVRDSIVANCL